MRTVSRMTSRLIFSILGRFEGDFEIECLDDIEDDFEIDI